MKNTSALAQFRELLVPQHSRLFLAVLCVVVGAALEIVPPLLVQRAVDFALPAGNIADMLAAGFVYVLVGAAAQAIGFGSNYLIALLAQNTLRDLRIRVFAKLQQVPVSYFDNTPLGDTISRCTADVDTIDTLFSSGVANMLTDVARLLVVVAAMAVLSPLLTVIALAGIGPLLWLTVLFQRRTRDAERAQRQAVGMMNTHLHETLMGVEVLRALGQPAFFLARFRSALRDMLAAYLRATRFSAVYTPLMVILAAGLTSVLLWAGASGSLVSVGTLAAFVLLFRRMINPITSLGEEWQTVQSAFAGAERVFQVLALPVDAVYDATVAAPALPQKAALNAQRPLIELERVTFGYVNAAPILSDVSFYVHAGEQVALVGRTGAGKSTLAHLVGGLYAPWTGAVRVCDIDSRMLTETQRHALLGVVPQMMQLFSGTVRENLTMWDATVSDQKLFEAACAAGADEFVRALPQGYQTPLTSGSSGVGAQLSSGQRQLLALARALVRQPAVLLLDEATAAIDNASDAAFRAALRGSGAEKRAVLIVAHRLSTAREADRVIVLEAGRIIEQGPPEALARQGGRFAALLALEAAGVDWQAQ